MIGGHVIKAYLNTGSNTYSDKNFFSLLSENEATYKKKKKSVLYYQLVFVLEITSYLH